MNNTGKIVTAVAAGAAVGAILGILFAPEKGSETRKRINDQGKKLAAGVKDKFENLSVKLKDMKEDIQHKMKETADGFA